MTLLEDVQNARRELKALRESVVTHEEQINGKRGLQAAIDELAEEVRSLRRSIYQVGGGIVLSSIGFGVSVLLLIGGP